MFKNAMIYQVTESVLKDVSGGQLEGMLKQQSFKPCTQGELSSFGFVNPVFNDDTACVFEINNGIVLKAKRQEKIIPSSMISELVDKKVTEIESTEGRFVSRKEKLNIKEDIIHQLLPQAFDKNTYSILYWDFERNLIIINERSPSKAENLLGLLRSALGSLPVRPLSTDEAPEIHFTDWVVKSTAPANFELSDKCKLESPQADGGVIQCKREDLTRDDIIAHVKSGKQVTQIGLVWAEALEFTVDNSLRLSGIKLTDIGEQGVEDLVDPVPEDRFAADMELSTRLICKCYDDLMESFKSKG